MERGVNNFNNLTQSGALVSNDRKRLNYMDIMKGLAIIMVAMGHIGTHGGKLIYMFHMPLFFFISGYFYKESYTNVPIELLKKRSKTLYLTFIKYEIIFVLLHNLFYKINFYNSSADIPQKAYTYANFCSNIVHVLVFDGTELLLSPLWFLTSLFIVTILFCFISYIVNKTLKLKEIFRAVIIIFLVIIGRFLTKIGMHIDNSLFGEEIFNVSFVALLYFYVGFLYKKHELKIKMHILIASVALVILVIGAKYSFNMDMRINYYPNFIVSIIGAISGIYFMVYLSKKMDESKFKFTSLKYIGKNTIIIMALHLTCFKFVELLQILVYKLPLYSLGNYRIMNGEIWIWWILYVTVGIGIPISIIYIFEKIRKSIIDINAYK